MKIKKFDAFGFKSFAEKISLTFPSGITTIVGPNGCGKSNIVDAIRWVLGEQGAKSLRGKSMEDVIFNGTERRKPLGMAEVALTFSNDNGLTLQGYEQCPEISIKRRIFRSGESEYFINNTHCRLKDILDLFMDTGVGTKAYSIIGQGRIEWLVNAKPEDRRILIEEAAGIHKYKSRKDAAIRKLEATELNLVRVSDIVKEIKRQIGSLQYQAGKARRYKSAESKIKDYELYLWTDEYNQLNKVKETVDIELKGLKDKELGLSTALSRKEKNQEELKVGALKKSEDLNENQERVVEAERTIQKLNGDMDLNQLKLEQLKEERTNLDNGIDESKERSTQLNQEKGKLKESMTVFIRDIAAKEKELETKEGALNSLLAKLLPQESSLEERKKSIVNIVADLTTCKNSSSYLERGMEELKEKVEANSSEKGRTSNLISNMATDIKEFSDKLTASREKRELFKEKLKKAFVNIEQLKKESIEKEKAFYISKDTYTKESSKLYSLVELDKSMGDFCDTMKSILDRGKSGTNSDNGIHGLVADIVETQPMYERAVEAVLGERLQYVVIEKQENGVEAIQYLKSEKSGRGGFIPLKIRDINKGLDDQTLPANAKSPLLDCIKIKKGFETVANYLFKDVLLTEDIDSALEIWQQNGITKTIVTLDGDIIDPSGTLSGGSHSGKDAGVLKRKREVKELQSLVENLKKEEERLEEAVLILSKNLSKAEGELEMLKEENHRLEIDELAKENDYKRLEKERSLLQSRQELLNMEGDEFSSELENISSKLKSALKEKEALASSLAQEENALTLLETQIKQLREEKEDLFKELTELKVDLASLREKRESLQNASFKADTDITEIEKRLSISRERMITNFEEEDQLLSDIAMLKDGLETALKVKDKIRAEKIVKDENYQVFLEKIKTLDEEIGHSRRELSTFQKSISDSQLTLKEFELKLMHLQEKVREKYRADLDSSFSLEKEEQLSKNEIKEKLEDLQKKIISLGDVNLAANEELEQLEERYNFLTSQQDDLNKSIEGLHQAIGKINKVTKKRFKEAYDTINIKFQEVYTRLFEGGKAELRLTDESNLLECGIDIVAQPKGKKLQNITLLSGGEKALTALSLIFSIFLVKPSPFCILDEADAPLDDANILRFNKMVTELAEKSQFILITHNKKTMEISESLFGITMSESGISTLLSVRMNDTDSNHSKVA